MNARGGLTQEIEAGTEAEGTSFDVVFSRHYQHVARILARVVRDPARAEELAVDVFWKFHRHAESVDGNPAAWLYRTAVRVGLDELRRRTRRERYEKLLGFLKPSPTPEELHAAAQEQTNVRTVLAILPPAQAQLLLLRSHGLSYNEVAAALNLNPASVGTLLGRAQQAFRKEYVNRYGEQ